METQAQATALSKAQIREALRAKGWSERNIVPVFSLTDDSKQALQLQAACLGYLVRALNKGLVPDPQLLADTLRGKKPVPNCGYLGCTWDAEHVH